MARKLTLDEFIERSREVHDIEWDFSQATYINGRTKVKLRCPIHSVTFEQTPENHLTGRVGCPVCIGEARRARLQQPFSQMVRDARGVHGDKYQYIESTYSGALTPMTIVCPDHGNFRQRPDKHINEGNGCPDCGHIKKGRSKRLTEAEINQRLYDKSRGNVRLVPSSYVGVNANARFVCRQHGEYKRNVNLTLHTSHPCVDCAIAAGMFHRPTTEDARALLERLYPSLTIEPFEYRHQRTLITFACKVHNESFNRRWKEARKGTVVCDSCWRDATYATRIAHVKLAYEATRKSRYREWVAKAIERHGDKYDYSDCDAAFSSQRRKIPIICPIHGSQPQTPIGHLTKGCRRCANDELLGRYTDTYFERYPNEKDRRAILYYLRFCSPSGHRFHKCGITINNVDIRHSMAKQSMRLAVLGTRDTTLYDAFNREQEIQKKHGDASRLRSESLLADIRRLRIGATECFSRPIPRGLEKRHFGTTR